MYKLEKPDYTNIKTHNHQQTPHTCGPNPYIYLLEAKEKYENDMFDKINEIVDWINNWEEFLRHDEKQREKDINNGVYHAGSIRKKME